MDHVYKINRGGSLVASFSFVDVDGSVVTGEYQNDNIFDILNGLGYAYLCNEMLHPTQNPANGDFNGIIDITKPIHITITPYLPPV